MINKGEKQDTKTCPDYTVVQCHLAHRYPECDMHCLLNKTANMPSDKRPRSINV